MTTMTWGSRIGFALIALVASAQADDKAKKDVKKADAKKVGAVFISPSEVQWGDAPPDLPKGAQIAVLNGNPMKAGPYTIRLKAPDGYKIPPHWHSKNEELTVLSGTLVLHMGDEMTSPSHDLDAGSFHYLPAKMHHAAESKGETIVQISGTGPFDIHYLNAADNPNPKTAKK